eukprot:Skav207345  [mRNA]  locus=scaffold426:88274:88504:- [translate_table: standard]
MVTIDSAPVALDGTAGRAEPGLRAADLGCITCRAAGLAVGALDGLDGFSGGLFKCMDWFAQRTFLRHAACESGEIG